MIPPVFSPLDAMALWLAFLQGYGRVRADKLGLGAPCVPKNSKDPFSVSPKRPGVDLRNRA